MALVPFPSPVPDGDDEQRLDDAADAGKMSFLEHLDELRKRLIYSAYALAGGCVISYIFINRTSEFVLAPLAAALPPGTKLMYTAGPEAFLLYLKLGALVGLFLALPMILWQVWLFVAPGLYANEKRFAIPFVVFSTVFFVSGAAFAHYIAFPWAWAFFAGFGTEFMEFRPKVSEAFSLYVKMVLGLGAVFQIPTLVLFLAQMGVVTPRFLIRHSKYAVLISFIVAAVLSPPDVVSQFLFAVPMLFLYAFSILVAYVFQKRQSSDE
jgi:sec-independent protein translocase protein TatC